MSYIYNTTNNNSNNYEVSTIYYDKDYNDDDDDDFENLKKQLESSVFSNIKIFDTKYNLLPDNEEVNKINEEIEILNEIEQNFSIYQKMLEYEKEQFEKIKDKFTKDLTVPINSSYVIINQDEFLHYLNLTKKQDKEEYVELKVQKLKKYLTEFYGELQNLINQQHIEQQLQLINYHKFQKQNLINNQKFIESLFTNKLYTIAFENNKQISEFKNYQIESPFTNFIIIIIISMFYYLILNIILRFFEFCCKLLKK